LPSVTAGSSAKRDGLASHTGTYSKVALYSGAYPLDRLAQEGFLIEVQAVAAL
jgi:hypothetical protein